MVIKYQRKNSPQHEVKGMKGDETHTHTQRVEKRQHERKELFMVCILHNINYVIKLPESMVFRSVPIRGQKICSEPGNDGKYTVV